MATPQYLQVRHALGDRKGTILDIPGERIQMLDSGGKDLASGFSLKLLTRSTIQPDKSKAPVEIINIRVVRSNAEGVRESYVVTQPVKRVMESFHDVVREVVGDDAAFETDDPYDKLLLLVMASSEPKTEHLAPTFTTPEYVEENGHWMYRGKLICNKPIEICREIKTEEGATLYRLRLERPNQPGFFDYATCSYADLLAGNHHLAEQSVCVHSAVKTFMALQGRFEALDHAARLRQANDEYTQPSREAQALQEKRFWGFADRR